MQFRGSMVALVTPFKDGRLDEDAFREFIAWQIASGADVLVPCGTTGEAATLEPDERDRIIRITVEEAAGRAPVLAGAGSNSTSAAIRLARTAKAAGADGTLQVTPYYNKPTQEGLYRHFKAIAEVVDLPMVLYNVPGRTSVNMLPETTLRLAAIDIVVGIKEACGNLEQIKGIIKDAPDEFSVFSGDDAMNLDIYAAGGRGCISVTSNVAPDRVAAVWDAFSEGHTSTARRLHLRLEALNRAMFLETNPIPAKTALAAMGRCCEEFRLPLTPMSEGPRAELIRILKQNEIIA
ncbi:MAG: 4-hydroxy-tetrahydrodipicolinate synthase [Pseudomonadota bacterium]